MVKSQHEVLRLNMRDNRAAEELSGTCGVAARGHLDEDQGLAYGQSGQLPGLLQDSSEVIWTRVAVSPAGCLSIPAAQGKAGGLPATNQCPGLVPVPPPALASVSCLNAEGDSHCSC